MRRVEGLARARRLLRLPTLSPGDGIFEDRYHPPPGTVLPSK